MRPKNCQNVKNMPESSEFYKMKRIPYGITNFEMIRKEDYYYVDKTRYIEEMECAGRYIFLMRPRRFGKSLFLDVLYDYYDINRALQFDEIYGGTYIHSHQTPDRGKYMVMKFNFSIVNPDPKMVDESFNEVALNAIEHFMHRYAKYLPSDIIPTVMESKRCDAALNKLMDIVNLNCDLGIYIMIDEYDNFANTLLSYDEEGYRTLTHGMGFFRLFFNVLKGATTGTGSALQRLFVTGVTPLTLSDVTSGFNIGRNVSMDEEFNEAIGFSETEVREMLDYYREATGVFKHTNDEIIEHIRPWYDNYCFAEGSADDDRMFNSDMILYFMNNYIRKGEYPKNMIDDNVTSDMAKTQKMVSYDKRPGKKASVIEEILFQGYTDSNVARTFRLENLGDSDSIVGLLYYLGLLSYGKSDDGYICPVITNQVVREQYYTYLAKYYNEHTEWHTDYSEISSLGKRAARRGEGLPLVEYICNQMNEQTGVRDFNRDGEAFVKAYIISTIGNNNGFFVCTTEHPANHGYCDILLTPIGKQLFHAYIIELKYLKPIAKAEQVEQYYQDAIAQLNQYAQSHPLLTLSKNNNWHLHRIACVIRGWTLERLEELDIIGVEK